MPDDTTATVYLPPGNASIALGGKTCPVAEDGSVEIPSEDLPAALAHGARQAPFPVTASADPIEALTRRVSVLESAIEQLGDLGTRLAALEKPVRK
jgi:hypothetical protein